MTVFELRRLFIAATSPYTGTTLCQRHSSSSILIQRSLPIYQSAAGVSLTIFWSPLTHVCRRKHDRHTKLSRAGAVLEYWGASDGDHTPGEYGHRRTSLHEEVMPHATAHSSLCLVISSIAGPNRHPPKTYIHRTLSDAHNARSEAFVSPAITPHMAIFQQSLEVLTLRSWI